MKRIKIYVVGYNPARRKYTMEIKGKAAAMHTLVLNVDPYSGGSGTGFERCALFGSRTDAEKYVEVLNEELKQANGE